MNLQWAGNILAWAVAVTAVALVVGLAVRPRRPRRWRRGRSRLDRYLHE